jgi:hypothetical protein
MPSASWTYVSATHGHEYFSARDTGTNIINAMAIAGAVASTIVLIIFTLQRE